MQMTPKPALPTPDDTHAIDIETLADTFKALSDPNRLRLLFQLLGTGAGQCVGQTAGCCDVDLSVVSRHLSVMRRAGIITREKCGKEVVYRIDQQNLPAVLRSLADALESCCQTASDKNEERKNENQG